MLCFTYNKLLESGKEENRVFIEIRTFLIMLVGGLIIGIFYDLYRSLWLKRHNRNWRKHIGDITFSLLASGLILSLLFYSNWVELRLYIFFGIGFGIFTYFKVIKLMINYFRLK